MERSENPAPIDKLESGPACQFNYLCGRPIAWMFVDGSGSNEPAEQQKMHARLKMREVGNRHE